MTSLVVFMLEERSMGEFLEGLLPRLVPALRYVLVTHEGKADLERSLPRKLRAWRTPGARFVVVRDQDAGDCVSIKRRLAKVAADAGKPDTVVRIACRELESWMLGDPEGFGAAIGRRELAKLATKEMLRDPDRLGSPSNELHRLLKGYSKTAGARAAGVGVSWTTNRSRSFQHFVAAVQRLAAS